MAHTILGVALIMVITPSGREIRGRPAMISQSGRNLWMKRQAIRDLVDLLAIRIKADADEIESIGMDRRDRGAVIGVVAGGKQIPGVNRGLQSTLDRATQRSRELLSRSSEDQDRLPNQRAVGLARSVAVALSGEFRIESDLPAG